jgi:uncharacterized protein
MKSTAVLVRELRECAGLTQAEFAERALMAQSAVSDYERGRKEPGVVTLARLAGAVGRELTIEFVDQPPGDSAIPTLREVRGHRRAVSAACKRHGASRPRVFGSVAAGTARVDSDIDILVDLEPGRTYFDVAALNDELETILGRSVDVLTSGAVHGRLAEVARLAVPL